MPDESTITTDNSSTSPYEGVSTPPNGGQVSATGDAPSSEMQTPQTAQTLSTNAPAPQQPSAEATQSQSNSGQPAMPKTPPSPQSPQSNQTTEPVHPSVQRAGIVKEIAQTLAGGQRYTYSVDPNTGTMNKIPVPMSNTKIGLAIALEAISGALTGLSQQGPNASARGAAQAFQAGEKNAVAQQDKQKQQAQEDYTRHAQILETNMRMRTNAMQVGKLDEESNEKYVGQFKDLADKLQNDYPTAIKGFVNYSDFGKYNVTTDNAIPYAVVPRLDKDGKRVTDSSGIPLSDINYMVLDPNLKATGLITPEEQAAEKKYNIQGSDNPALGSYPMSLRMSLNRKTQVQSLMLLDNELQNYSKAVNESSAQPQYQLEEPTIDNDEINSAVDKAAKTYTNVPKALIKGVILGEDGKLDPKATSPKGAVGLMQLLPNTATQLGVTDPTNVEQNILGGTHYLSQQMQRYNGNIPLALAAYNAGPGNVTDHVPDNGETKQYVDGITSRIKYDPNAVTQPDTTKQLTIDLPKLLKEDPTLAPTLAKFQAALMATGQGDDMTSYGRAIQSLAKTDPTAANRMTNLLGGLDNINKYDLNQHINVKIKNDEEANKAAETRKLQEAKDTKALANESIQAMSKALEEPPNWNPSVITGFESRNELKSILQKAGVQTSEVGGPDRAGVPFDTLYAIGHYDLNPKTTAPPKVYNNGKQYEMDAQTMLDYIRKFVNPNYNDGDYDQIHKARVALGDPKSPAGIATQAVGTALQHLGNLDTAIDQLNNHGNYAPLNALANLYNVNVGDTPITTFKAIAPKVADEVSKAAMAGGTPYQGQIEEGRDTMSANLSPQQQHAVTRAWRGLISERFNTLDGIAMATAKEHIKVPPEVGAELRKYGFETRWDNNSSPASPQSNVQNTQNQTVDWTKDPNYSKVPNGATPLQKNNKIVGYVDAQGKRVPIQ